LALLKRSQKWVSIIRAVLGLFSFLLQSGDNRLQAIFKIKSRSNPLLCARTAFSFGNINSDCVHMYLLNLYLQLAYTVFSLPIQSPVVTRTQQIPAELPAQIKRRDSPPVQSFLRFCRDNSNT
jgi:hypothetical protein